MNSLQIHEQILYQNLQPLFSENGYEACPENKLFRKATKSGSRSVLFNLKRVADGQLLEVNFGMRFEIIESLVYQFLNAPKESNTILVDLDFIKHQTKPPFIITDEASLRSNCKRISDFMEKKGFRALQALGKLKKVDAVVNRKPHLPCLYMNNGIYRCFKGVTLARLLQRTDFNQLIAVYKNYLYQQWVPQSVVENFKRLVHYLRYFSFN